jgi:hypothetical protein
MSWSDSLSTRIQISIDIHDNTNNDVGTNTSKQQLWLKGWGGSLHTNTSCRVVPGRLSLGRRETGGMCIFCLPAYLSSSVYLSHTLQGDTQRINVKY